ncbi:MAG: transporter [Kiritimatiellia bacterium]
MSVRKLLLFAAAGILPVLAGADTQRTTYGFENRFPGEGRLEMGGEINFQEIEVYNDGVIFQDYRRTSFGAYGRYGIWENLNASATLPFVESDPDPGGSETGLGDIQLGLQLKAYEDIFEYPFVIPHLSVSLPTGEEDSGTGNGESILTYGLSVGTVTWDWMTWILDASYEAHGEIDDVVGGSLSLIADVSKRFSVIGEIRVTDEPSSESDDYSADALAGISYDWSKRFTTVFSAGGALDNGDDFLSVIRAGYTW